MCSLQNCRTNFYNRNSIFVVTLLVTIITFSFFCTSYGDSRQEPTKKIVVGYPLLDSVHEISDENRFKGYNYEYLKEISRYTGWEYEFVIDSWDNCIQGLKDGTIDLMGFVFKNDERSEFLEYTKLPSGIASAILVADDRNKELSYKDYSSLDESKVGILLGSNLEKLLDEFCKEKNINMEKIYYYTEKEMLKRLLDGKIDVALSTTYEVNERNQIIVDFSSDPFYFVVSKKSKDYKEKIEKLNSAINEIFILEPNYNEKLFNAYVPSKSRKFLNLTEKEKEFIRNSNPIKVAYDPNWRPLVYYDEKTDNMNGAVAYLLQRVQEKSGLKFEYVKKDNYTEALDTVKSGEAWIITNFFRDYSWAEKSNIRLTTPYIVLPVEKVVNGKSKNDIVVMPKHYLLYYKYKELENEHEVKYVDSIEDCYKALIFNEAKCTYVNSYISSYMMSNRKYFNLETIPSVDNGVEVCMGIYEEAPEELISIIDKVSLTITREEVNQMAMKATLDLENHSLQNLIYRNPNTALVVASAFFTLVLIIIFVYMREKRNKEKAMYYNLVTGIWNFGKFCIEADKLLRKNDYYKKCAILHVNISKFRFVNDSYGFEVGNEVLRTVASIFKKVSCQGELYASLWADHFVCLVRCEDERHLKDKAKAIVELLNKEILKNCELRVVFRAGAYFITQDDIKSGKSINDMLQYANHALSSIGDSYKNVITCFDEDIKNQIEALKLVDKDMLKAFYNREFVPYYQPKYNIYTNEISGAEALVRWLHPVEGIMSPSYFLPYFEKGGFIVEVDLYIFEETCKLIKTWIDEGKKPITVSCNFSRLHFREEDFVDKLKVIVEKYNIPFKYLELELTETIAVEEMDTLTKKLSALHELGFSVSIDDFGSGYSSLSVLQRLKVDTIKLDKTFLEYGVINEREYKVMQAIVNLADQLQMQVICEGVETAEHVALLRQVNCDFAQGYYYARPMSIDKLNDLLEKKQK